MTHEPTAAPRGTPLKERHEALGARMVDFHGWRMPIQYVGVVEEHLHTRRLAGAFDVSHMGRFVLRGPSAADDLDRAITCPTAALPVGRCRYGLLLNEEGGIEDDLLVYRTGEEEFWVVVNASRIEADAARLRPLLSPSTEWTDESPRTAMIAVQGPASREALQPAADMDLAGLRYYRCAECAVFGERALVSRTGYTGELGYELIVDAAAAGRVWDALLERPEVKPIGLGARDTLRLEMGMPLYGSDMTSEHTPVEAGLMAAVDLSKEFVGRGAVAARAEEGPRRRRIGFVLEGRRAARSGDELRLADRTVGAVTSGSFAPSLGYAVGLGYVEPAAAAPGTTLEALVRGKAQPCRVEPWPFYRAGTAAAG